MKASIKMVHGESDACTVGEPPCAKKVEENLFSCQRMAAMHRVSFLNSPGNVKVFGVVTLRKLFCVGIIRQHVDGGIPK
jgi:hypothetical protein